MIRRLFSETFSKKPMSEDTLLVFVTKNLNDMLLGCIRECVRERQTLVLVPVYRGDNNIVGDLVWKSRDNIQVRAKEVGRT